MSVSRKRRSSPGSSTRRRPSSLLIGLLTCVVLLAGGSASKAASPSTISPELSAPFADALSASSWLLVTGQDPRYGASGSVGWGSGLATHSTPTTSTAAQPQPDPDQGQIVSRQLGSIPVTSDPSLAIDPNDPKHLLLAATALDLPSVVIYASRDGGQTWDGPRQVPYFPLDAGSLGGPVVTFDSEGTAYVVSRSLTFVPLQIGDQRFQSVRTRIVVAKSGDGGLTWDEPISAVLSVSDVTTATDEAGQSVSSAALTFLDWPSLLIAPDPQQPARATLYLTYTELRAQFSARNAGALTPGAVESTIRLVRSTDRGATWSAPIDVSPIATLSLSQDLPNVGSSPSPNANETQPPIAAPPASGPMDVAANHQMVQGAQATSLADGTLLVAYFDTTDDGPHQGLARILVTSSTDGGRTFSEPAPAGIFREIAATPRTTFMRWWSSSFPRLIATAEGTLLIATTAKPASRPSADGEVLLLRSPDGGASWSSPVTLGAESASMQFFPELSAADDGTLHAIWADTRDDPGSVSFAVYHAQSRDGGATWEGGEDASGERLSGELSNTLLGFPGGIFLGDRFGLASSGEGANVAWPDTSGATSSAPQQQIRVVSVRSSPD